MLLQPHSEPVTKEVIGHSEGKGNGNIQAPSRWDKLVAEFHDIFDSPAMAVIEILCIILNFFPMLNLTTDANIECLQLSQKK